MSNLPPRGIAALPPPKDLSKEALAALELLRPLKFIGVPFYVDAMSVLIENEHLDGVKELERAGLAQRMGRKAFYALTFG